MASIPARTACVHPQHHFNWTSSTSNSNSSLTFSSSLHSLTTHISSLSSSINHSRSSPTHLHHPFCGPPSNPNRRILRCWAATPGPPPGNEPQGSTGIAVSFTRIWDTVQIFFAVLFWMSLFFWASASDRKNTGRRNKGNRFRK